MAPAAAGVGAGEGRKNSVGLSGHVHHSHHVNKTKKKQKAVCVMDASGALGKALVQDLLHRGYIVHAALQSKGDIQWFKEQIGGDDIDNTDLRLFHADLFDYHSIQDALTGCSGLFYSFEPPLEHSLYDEHMAEIEVRAAHNVLEACAQTDTMEKVVFTSSATAVVWTDARNASSSSSPSSSPCDIDERNWSDISFCKKFKLWHALSKTLAEKTAWALAMDRGVSMVSVNAGLLQDVNKLSTNVTTTNNTSYKNKNVNPINIPPYLKGAAEMYEDGVLVTVDLRFLVDAHICVFEDVSSYGRYLCFNHVINCHEDAVKLATSLMSSTPQSLEDTTVYPQRISNKKLNKLMVNFDGRRFELE